MTRAEAEQRCAELNREHGAEGFRWLAQELEDGDWRVVSVRLPDGLDARPWKTTVEQRPRPDEPPDPRPAIFRNIPPFGPSGS